MSNPSFDKITTLLQQVEATGDETLNRQQINQLLNLAGAGLLITDVALTSRANINITLQNTREFGMILSAGVGGDDADIFIHSSKKSQATVCASTELTDAEEFLTLFQNTIAYKQLTSKLDDTLVNALNSSLKHSFSALISLGNHFSPTNSTAPYVIQALSLDPCGLVDNEWTVNGGDCSFSKPQEMPAPRPIGKIDRMLHPKSIGIIGVSGTKMNFGRIILKNIIASGYDTSNITIIRPNADEIDGVKCVDSLSALDHKLDLFVVAIAADAVFALADEIIETDAAESVMLIPGGLGETEASRDNVAVMVEKINARHKLTDGGPIFLGGNCLGIVSHPGGYDTWFIPKNRLPQGQKKSRRNLALISQSGAFMISRISNNPWLDPAYMAALGNQNDLSHGDMISYFAEKDDIDVIGVYVEGFRDMDGLAFAKAVRQAVINGKQVVLYKAGKTSAAAAAALGHTASIAGDYALCEAVITQAGGIVTEELSLFNDIFYIADVLHQKTVGGNRLGAVSGAGFEAVGMADSILAGGCSLSTAEMGSETTQRLEQILSEKRLDALMEVRNPMDINPGADDEAHLQCTEAFANDPNVDAVVVGLDPMSPVMRTLVENTLRPGYDLDDEQSIAHQMPKMVAAIEKPIIGIIDGGTLYDPLVGQLMDRGVCVFRSCSRGVNALAIYTDARVRSQQIIARYGN